MKKLYILNLLLCVSIFSIAQFKPITNGKWISERHNVTCLDNNMLDDFCLAKQYMIEGDSFLNLKKYYKIYCIEKTRKSYSIPFSYNFSNKYFCGLITNDSINKKIYYLPEGTNNDTLLFDFNLKKHDTLPKTYINSITYHYFVVDSIDSVYYNSKYYRKYFLKSDIEPLFPQSLFLLEGQGSSVGLLEDLSLIYSFESGNWLSCFSSSAFSYHSFNTYDNIQCDIETNINNKLLGDFSFKIYPNHVSSQLTVETTPLAKERILTILNIKGQELIRKKLVDTKTQIDISNLTSGIYFVKLITDKTVEVRKIIKE
ncbi:MAG: T9SS type A sorting domain-containing protein [Bacteroidales bacterium]|jgi:hypothetical protein